jgi:hypothetical protein
MHIQHFGPFFHEEFLAGSKGGSLFAKLFVLTMHPNSSDVRNDEYKHSNPKTWSMWFSKTNG